MYFIQSDSMAAALGLQQKSWETWDSRVYMLSITCIHKGRALLGPGHLEKTVRGAHPEVGQWLRPPLQAAVLQTDRAAPSQRTQDLNGE